MGSLVLPLLGGALLSNFHWAPALALGGIVVALIVKRTVSPSVQFDVANPSDTSSSFRAAENR
jgi:hypothetical protein